jgi:outer membrane receptor protein involved in Fe transport
MIPATCSIRALALLVRRSRAPILIGLTALVVKAEDPIALDPMIVSASRAPEPADNLPVTVDVFVPDRVQQSPSLAVDDTLREAAAFSLFRRSGSLSANPTAQGVSLRGLGPSGASRSLVLLDGVPLNDPFGGWVAWSAVPREALDRIEIVRGGGSGAWGNSALGGTVQLFSLTPSSNLSGNRTAGEVTLSAGDHRTGEADFTVATSAAQGGAVRVSGSTLTTDGFFAVDPAQRGAVDRPLSTRSRALLASWSDALSSTMQATITARFFDEQRNNGTVLQRNDSRLGQLVVSLAGASTPDLAWSASAYLQRQHFDSFFSSVNATRSAETPANDQFDVPTTAAGASAQATWRGTSSTTTLGSDLRWVEGETHEDFLFSGGQFTRRRIAGGDQLFAGAFASHERSLGTDWRGTAMLRMDYWENTDGHRRETDLGTGAVVRDDSYTARRGTEPSPQLGLVWSPIADLKVRTAAYRAFRVPTLNEYYRPFRVGNVNTEANPSLENETLDGAEFGADFTGRAGRLAVTAFTNELHDAVANVTLSSTPALTSQQRQNLDRVRVQGLELTAEWRPHPDLRLRTDWLLSDATVRDAPNQPALVGLRLAQVPRQTLTVGIDWVAFAGVRMDARLRYSTRQFEDDENLLPLAPATTIDLRISRRFSEKLEIYVAVENVLDARVETGRSTDGMMTFGSPRFVRVGLRSGW